MSHRLPRLVVGLLLVGLMGMLIALHESPGVASPRPVAARPASTSQAVLPAPTQVFNQHGFVGAAGCSASNCHGGNRSREGVHFGAYNIWVQQDPHAQAYQVLFNELSTQIAERLQLPVPAYESQQCLSCHSMVKDVDNLPAEQRFKLVDGVSCEACHGAAENWLEPHRSAAWKNPSIWSPARKAAAGFQDTKDLLTRARVCADCHVGAEGRDVNHDLIAAGHPRLDFEFSAYHANLPKHWDRTQDKSRNQESLEARLWVAGQVASAEAAAQLTQSRAANKEAPWPEFSEYSCFACHHDLNDPSWRQARSSSGNPPWGTWYFSLLPSLADVFAPRQAEEFRSGVRDLREIMEHPRPDRDLAATAASQLAQDLRSLGRPLLNDPHMSEKLRPLLTNLTAPQKLQEPLDWEVAAQLYLSLVAVRQGEREGRGISVRDPLLPQLQQIREQLRFPRGDNSPRMFQEDRNQAVRSELRRIHDFLEQE